MAKLMGEATCSVSMDVLPNKRDVITSRDAEDILQAECSLKALKSIAKRPPVNILFNNVEYSVNSYTGERRILHNVSGEFRSGELSCILGPSGAGKSTLLNILTGYTNIGVNGSIEVNGQTRDMRLFKKLSCYIMQDNLLQPRLTTLEALRIAADLKLGTDLTKNDKDLIVTEVLQTLGLWKHRHTICERLSGGQSRRLTIALELVNNPPVIFLDEPTSGLDVVSVRQLIVLLRMLSRQGRTVICTIHQPSASLFEFFDNVYIVCKGRCCYQGTFPLLVPFLAEVGFVCPISHNPADFVIETLTDETAAIKLMSELCENGKICRKTNHFTNTRTNIMVINDKKETSQEFTKEQMQIMGSSTSFFTQFIILMKRMYIQGKRNKISLMIQLSTYLFCAILMGGIFYLVGNEGSTPMANCKFYLSVLVFFVYTHAMIPILLFPTEIRIMRREYFNQWYGLKAFYAALTFSTIPSAIFFGTIFTTIAYVMSGQLFEWNRYILFLFAALLTGFCSEGVGLAIGSALNATNGSILGPAIVSPLLVLCCYGMGFGMYIEPN
ncbi:unnamed protein product, partial [Iphiclides podalirius]